MDSKLTQGKTIKALWSFSMPLVAAAILQQVYSITDALILGNFVGDGAIAVISVTGPIIDFSFFIIIGLMMGFVIQISYAYGEKNIEKLKKLTSTIVISLTAMGFAFTIPAMLMRIPILKLLNTPVEILAYCGDYLLIVFIALPFVLWYNLYGMALRAVGDGKGPLYSIVISSIINIGLDLLFVGVFGWGVKGAAFATAIAQGMSAIFVIVYGQKKYNFLKISFKKQYLDLKLLKECFILSLPKMLQSLMSTVTIMMLQRVINSMGLIAVTAISTSNRIEGLAILPVMVIGESVGVFVGQNMGAGKLGRAREGLKSGVWISGIMGLASGVLMFFGGGLCMKFFGVSPDAALLGHKLFMVCALFYPVYGILSSFLGYFQGIKQVKFSAFCSIFIFVARLIITVSLVELLGPQSFGVAKVMAWVIALGMCIWQYRRVKGISVAQQADEILNKQRVLPLQ